jgi:hypothetical protein
MSFDLETVEIHAAKNDASVCRSGYESQVAPDGSVEPDSINFYGPLNCELIRHPRSTTIILGFWYAS